MYIHGSMLEWHLGACTVPVIAAHLRNARSGALCVQTPPSSDRPAGTIVCCGDRGDELQNWTEGSWAQWRHQHVV